MAKKYNLINGGACKVDGCDRRSEKTGYCGMHYQRARTTGDVGPAHRISSEVRGVCSIEGCGKSHDCHGYCSTHNQRIKAGLDVGTSELLRRKKGEGTFRNGYHSVGIDRKLKYTHRIVAEKALGHKLPDKAVVHHIDGNPENNNSNNLVICEDNSYHLLLHKRQRALDKCGNANYVKCEICNQYDSPDNLRVFGVGKARVRAYHKECNRLKTQEYKRNILHKQVLSTHQVNSNA